jgi:SAM-dependent methyltransferase
MATTDRERWDRRHAADHAAIKPASFLADIFCGSAWTIRRGRALDIATGKGRNALFLAGQGFEVDAIDISAMALDQARAEAEKQKLHVSWREADLERIELPEAYYDFILDFNYLQRSLVGQMKQALRIDGYVVFETYLIDQRAIGHPSNPAYLLGHNELLEWFRDFRVLWYREGKFTEGGEASFRAGIFAQKLS